MAEPRGTKDYARSLNCRANALKILWIAENGWGPTKNSRGGESVAWMFRLGLAAYNLVRLGKLVSDFAAICPRAYRNEQSLIFPVPFGQSCVFLKQRIAFIPGLFEECSIFADPARRASTMGFGMDGFPSHFAFDSTSGTSWHRTLRRC